MNKQDRNTLSSLVSVIVGIFLFVYRDFFTKFIPIEIYIFVAIFFAVITGQIVIALLPKPKRKVNKKKIIKTTNIKNKKKSSSEIGKEFEQLCYDYFKDKGFNPIITKSTGDHGVDLIIKDPSDGLQIAVQCKKYKTGSNIGNADIIKLEGGKRFYKCTGALFITTSNYTSTAKEFAESVNMELWNGLHVADKIDKWQKSN